MLRYFCAFPSWPGVTGPSRAPAEGDGPVKPGHDGDLGMGQDGDLGVRLDGDFLLHGGRALLLLQIQGRPC